ncbi:hypothetical protein FB451DRAFT_1240506 [Mycena latifolia]|nr:hypothetical protein FB451DRAFT_1240506 [Mycena latifolia]
MVPVPQELIDAIVNEVEDAKALKACSLTASAFREPSQRMLIHSLTLSRHASRPSANAWCARLTESPRIARYITTVTIYLSFEDTKPPAVHTLQTIFARLMNVRRCVFSSGHDYFCPWEDLTPVAQVVVDFIQSQKLAELNVRYFANLPPSVLACFLSAAPKISFLSVQVDTDAIGEHLSNVKMAPSKPKQLLLAEDSSRVCDALTRPEFSSYMSDLRILEVWPEPEYRIDMLSSASTQLEHICVDCTRTYPYLSVPSSVCRTHPDS